MYAILKDRAKGLEASMLDFASRLVATSSVSLDEGKVADLVEEEMKTLGYDRVIRDDAGNVVGVLYGREASPTLLLNCHMDTVPLGADDVWTDKPLSGKIADGWLHGIGSADCKGGLAAQVYAGALLKRSLLPLKGNLVAAATVAEENGRSIGVRELLAKTLPEMDLAPTWAVLGEPTGAGLYYGHDGWAEFEINIEGANPFQVDDAAQAVLNDLDRGNGHVSRGEPTVQEVHAPRFENANGTRRATIRMARRLQPADRVDEVVGEIAHSATAVSRPMGAVAVAVKVRQEPQRLYSGTTTMVKHVTHAWAIDPFCPLMERARQSLAAAGCGEKPGKWELGRLGMGTAGGVMLNAFDLPVIGYGPGLEAQAHAVNEAVETDKLVEVTFGTACIAHGLIGIPVWGWTSDEI